MPEGRPPLSRLVLYVIDQLRDHGGSVSTIRIVKLLYLIDVEHYRRYGRILTGVDWFFYHYGPYASELAAVLAKPSLDLGEETVRTQRGFDARVFSVAAPQSLEDITTFAVETMVRDKVAQWAMEDTRTLLDYVYTSTEPMRRAVFGERLDFTTIQPGFDQHAQTRHIRLSTGTSPQIRVSLRARLRRTPAVLDPPPRHDEVYAEACLQLQRDEEWDLLVGGRVRITAETAAAFREQSE